MLLMSVFYTMFHCFIQLAVIEEINKIGFQLYVKQVFWRTPLLPHHSNRSPLSGSEDETCSHTRGQM